MNKQRHACLRLLCFVLVLGAATALLGSDAFGMEETGTGRKLWNGIMLWVNFGILVFLFNKYGKKPLMDFLDHEREKIKETLDAVTTQLDEARTMMDAEVEKLNGMDEHLEELRKTIVELGQREKERLVEVAKSTADQMIEDAEKESGYRLAAAKKALNDEMVDIAVSIVEKRLARGLTPEDNKKLVNEFIADLETSKSQLQ